MQGAHQQRRESVMSSPEASSMSTSPQENGYTLPVLYFGPQERPLDYRNASAATSPVEQATTYYPEEKILMTDSVEKQCVEKKPTPVAVQPEFLLSKYNNEAPNKPVEKKESFWKRHAYWILGIVVLLVILFSIVGVVIARLRPPKGQILEITRNNTLNSIASTGLTLLDKKTWNMHVFSQNSSSGQIELQVSLDGHKFEPPTNVSLTIPPRVGSPISATAEQDTVTGVIMLNLFYISGINNVTMSALTCAEGSAKCGTINNCRLPTTVPVSRETGLAAVNVNNSQDWRVYYHDQSGFISQLQGNASGFDTGARIGGEGLNGSDITAVNINSTTNNIHVFYTDMLTQALFTLQFENNWTTPRPVSNARVNNWNPYSGLGSAYRPALDQLHVYYTGLDKGVYEFVLNGTNTSNNSNTSFQPQPDGSRPWAEADYVGADITAIGWDDQLRFFQPARGRLVMGELNNTNWGEIFVDMITTGSEIIP
ncbi:hypothetical protein K3495_g3728 [Podosphaera aphanis]|nr:hypothetical protein K3495_g3728 [Podosphaera aphanis]